MVAQANYSRAQEQAQQQNEEILFKCADATDTLTHLFNFKE